MLLWNEVRAGGQPEQALDRYAAGWRGIMVDFMDRDDQPMLRFQGARGARSGEALVVNLHGVAKPPACNVPTRICSRARP